MEHGSIPKPWGSGWDQWDGGQIPNLERRDLKESQTDEVVWMKYKTWKVKMKIYN